VTVIQSWVGRRWYAALADEHPVELDRPARRWLEQRRRDAELAAVDGDRRMLVGEARKLKAAVERWCGAVGHVAAALANATVAAPPQPPPRSGRGGSDVADPTGARVEATWTAADQACVTFAHLAGRCADPDCHVCTGDRPADCLTAIADTLGVPLDLAATVDGLLGTPSSSTVAFQRMLDDTVAAYTAAAEQLREGWHEARRDGADPDVLTTVVDRTVRLAARMDGLVGAVTQWLPTSPVRRCEAGCGGAAPEYGKGATCQRCRDQRRNQAS
jgi:hypothetical protein